MCWMNVTCGACGYDGSLESFTETEISGVLPPGRFQCPACRHAFERRAAGGWQTYKAENGSVLAVPDRVELVSVPAVF